MKRFSTQIKVLSFLSLLVFLASCQSSVNKEQQKRPEKGSEQIPQTYPNLLKSRNANSGGNVHASLADQKGNLWFGTTADGLYKYDGEYFTQFTTHHGLSSNMIHHLMQDDAGKIWIATSKGLTVYDGISFSQIQIPRPKSTPPNERKNTHDVFSIIQTQAGELWFAGVDGVFRYDGETFTPFAINPGSGGFLSSNNNMEYMLEDRDGNLWFGGRVNEGVFRYDGKSIRNFKLDGDNWAWPVLQDKNGDIWFSNWTGAFRYDGDSFQKYTQLDGLSGNMISRLMEDQSGNIWFGGDGLCRYDGKSFTCFGTKNGLNNSAIWTILEEPNGNIWVGTRNTKLFRYDGKSFIDYSESD